ncbi:MAG: SDR family oxidoreductase [Planctomycetia bacterium]|nr:SDR family oxidoreductase [Planctomycetia bacterium]
MKEETGSGKSHEKQSVFLKGEKQSIFLTGATGLVGSYLLKELLIQGNSVAVLVRRSRKESAQQRIEKLVQNWENQLGKKLSRPIVIEGGLADPSWGSANQEWFKEYCGSIIHCAASLTFNGKQGGEPWSSNIEGTRNVLNVCKNAGIRTLHYVSTAYIAGSSEAFLEDSFDVGQTLRNDYEKSKFQAEKMVREVDFLDSLTVYRPSIVVGDSQTGYTLTYHGFYAVLKLAHTLAKRMPFTVGRGVRTLVTLGMSGSEHKNFVPVDWVASVFMRIFRNPQWHGKTYHLTNPNPPLILDFVEVVQEAVEKYSEFSDENDAMVATEDWFQENYAMQIAIYEPYLQDDPDFDTRNVQAAAGDLPCPRMTKDLMMFLAKKAILSDFGKK